MFLDKLSTSNFLSLNILSKSFSCMKLFPMYSSFNSFNFPIPSKSPSNSPQPSRFSVSNPLCLKIYLIHSRFSLLPPIFNFSKFFSNEILLNFFSISILQPFMFNRFKF
ncbi:hypothetical protein PAEPH01_2344 [Pancytospora epiphaga]|nr:hypothetical protein PAEPH01_2344 [Pancytospora epiphaga]